MNVPVIGGTRFIGRAIVEELLRRGHTVTVYHRGRHKVEFSGVARGQREGATGIAAPGMGVARSLPKTGNPDVVVRPATPDQRPLLGRIRQSSWGFFIPPNFARQGVLIAWLGEQAVGSTYLNRATGNLDFGVHVVREQWRQRVGTALLEVARQRCLTWRLPHMTVVRVLRALTTINASDRQAWCFYRACGGELLREVWGFRCKKCSWPLVLAEWEEEQR